VLGGISKLAVGLAVCAISALASNFEAQAQLPVCGRTVKAEVVAFDQPLMFNRIGAQNVNGMIYALRSDVVDQSTGKPEAAGGTLTAGNVLLRPDKRPRPIALRVAVGDCLEVKFTNLLSSQSNPRNATPEVMTINDQVAERRAGFTPLGLSALDSAGDTSSFVGKNANTLAAPGQTRTYRFYADAEGQHLVLSHAVTFGGEGTAGNLSNGLFGVVVVEPLNASFHRSQVTEEDMRLATIGTTPAGQPIINYEARYPNRAPWTTEGKAGRPILNMLDIQGSSVNIVSSDVTAIISGTNPDGSFAPETYPLESQGKRNPALPNRLEPFREFVAIFNDETVSKQAFPFWYEDPVFSHTLHGVGDHFMINQAAAGVGSEVIANRLRVGPAHDCLSCAYEEFFLTSFAMGDPAQLVDIPANAGLEFCTPQPGDPFCERDPSIRATYVKYPDDPANVSHSYIGDFVKFRNLHAGPKEHHVFHLHNHQWLSNPDDDNSNYLDAQGIGPGGNYTYEIAFGGSGNRNKSAGDAIYHCHYYPHFAQGMWALWRSHDTFEPGTRLDVSVGADGFHTEAFALESGKPAPGARAYPDGEILAGAPIPALVPLPGKALAPMPGRVYVAAVDKNNDGQPESSQAVIDRADTDPSLIDVRPVLASLNPADPDNQLNPTGLKNPGYPFWIGGMEGAIGQRAPSPPLDMAPNPSDPTTGGWDGGLPRHFLDGYAVGGVTEEHQTRFSFEKHLEKAKARFISEYGNDVERAAMSFHATRFHPTFRQLLDGSIQSASFRSNGQLPHPGSPFFEPCIDDEGDLFTTGTVGQFFSGTAGGVANTFTAAFGADNPRVYKAANIQLDVVFNKLGDHFPQQRIITLWEDVAPTLAKTRPPEPFVFRLNSYDCAMYYQTNLIPEFYMVDDYQVTTPTDIIGQHIHLPKWDLVSADGSANGWNYEDGVLGAESVRNRIEAINRYTLEEGTGEQLLTPLAHPFFGAGPNGKYLGARTMMQRWFVDPLHNLNGRDRGLGVTFTHDHFGPSTHQQVGLYATLLVNPAGSTWKHNETGVQLYTRADGGPTSWQAMILAGDLDGDGDDDSFREFYLEAQDFAHAYNKDAWTGVNANGDPAPPTNDSFRYALNPSVRKAKAFPDAVILSSVCPGGLPRPCPEAISADDIGTFVINYRNEPVGYRVYDPNKIGPDGKPGMQADGLAGDLAYAFQTRTDRKIPQLNTKLGSTPYPAMTKDVRDGDPFTPILRTNAGDIVRVKIQAGAHEHEHVSSIHGIKWLSGGGGFGTSPSSGWRSSMQVGLSEKASFASSMFGDIDQITTVSDYLYTSDSSHEGFWTGSWGVMRTYETARPDLANLPNNPRGVPISITNRNQFNGVCPKSAPVRSYDITAVAVNKVINTPYNTSIIPADASAFMHVGGPLDANGGTLRYNSRGTLLSNGEQGPLHDPTALVYIPTSDLRKDIVTAADRAQCANRYGGVENPMCPAKLPNNYKFEPISLRAVAGECVEVTLRNRLPSLVPDLAGYVMQHYTVIRDRSDPAGYTTFNNNLIRPSSHIGFHTQKVEYDISRDDGVNVGINPVQTIAPGSTRTYRFYAGDLELGPRAYGSGEGKGGGASGGLWGNSFEMVARPVEYGGMPIMPADLIKQGQKGLFGMLTILPAGSTFTVDPDTTAQATVVLPGGQQVRDFSMIIQKAINLRYRDGTPVENIAGEGPGVPEDAHDAGAASINYGTEPLWFRFGLAAGADWGVGGAGHVDPGAGDPGDGTLPVPTGPGFATLTNAFRAYSNTLTGGNDPQTPVYRAAPGQEFRLRVVSPVGYSRSTTLTILGHNWREEPFISVNSPSDVMANTWRARYRSTADNIVTGTSWNILTKAGGSQSVPGDYLFRDVASFGNTNGIWGIVRVEEPGTTP
jgi:manganese oxidase